MISARESAANPSFQQGVCVTGIDCHEAAATPPLLGVEQIGGAQMLERFSDGDE